MKLNKVEFLLMNNPLRSFIRDKVEAKRLRTHSSLEKGRKVLEIGCGDGTGTLLIKKYFFPKKIDAIDLDKKMIDIAQKKVKDPMISFKVASATKLPFKENSFDAIFDFGIIHHIPNWQDCLKELKRVLKKGGQLILEDLSIDTFQTTEGKVYRKVLDHPYSQMYTKDKFVEELKKLGFIIHYHGWYYPLHILKYFVVIAEKR